MPRYPVPKGYTGSGADARILSNQRGHVVPDRHWDGDEDLSNEQDFETFDYGGNAGRDVNVTVDD